METRLSDRDRRLNVCCLQDQKPKWPKEALVHQEVRSRTLGLSIVFLVVRCVGNHTS
jgi:hypothetical protein